MIQPGQARGAVLGLGGGPRPPRGPGVERRWQAQQALDQGRPPEEGARSDRGGEVCWEGLG